MQWLNPRTCIGIDFIHPLFLFFLFPDLFPYVENDAVTKEFLAKLFEVLFNFIKETNDRDAKILEFRHPEDMIKLLDLDIPQYGKNLQTLLEDCHATLKNQVKTGERYTHHFNTINKKNYRLTQLQLIISFLSIRTCYVPSLLLFFFFTMNTVIITQLVPKKTNPR